MQVKLITTTLSNRVTGIGSSRNRFVQVDYLRLGMDVIVLIIDMLVCDLPTLNADGSTHTQPRPRCCERLHRIQLLLSAYYDWLMLWRVTVRLNFALKITANKPQHPW